MKNYEAVSQKYQDDILSNKKKSPINIIKAIRRHQADIIKSKDDNYQYYYNPSFGSRVCRFIELLKHSKGSFARKNLILEPWQVFFIMTLFSWLKKENDFRRFFMALCEIPRKNGKSTLGAAILLYMLTSDGENSPECYVGANSKNQANLIFNQAREFCLNNEDLVNAFKLVPNKSQIFCSNNNGKLESVIKNVRDGANNSGVVIDELQESTTDAMIDAFKTGAGSRDNPLILITSTAGVNLASPLFDYQKSLEKVLDGLVEDDRFFGMIFNATKEDDIEDIEVWKSVNPNYGVSVGKSYLKAQLAEAKQYPERRNMILCKHLNLWMNATSNMIDLLKWNAGKDENIDISHFIGKECFMAVDMASRQDIASVYKVFVENGIYHIFGRNYLPAEAIEKNDIYKKFRDMGAVIETEGNSTDYFTILQDILIDCREYDVQNVGFDPWNSVFLIQTLEKELGENTSIDFVEMKQNAFTFHPILIEFEKLYNDNKLRHNDIVLDFCAQNVQKKYTNDKHFTITKGSADEKIDAFVAFIMALGGALRGSKNITPSVYEDEEFELLILE